MRSMVISLQSFTRSRISCDDADFDDELVHLCNLPVKRDEAVTARREKAFCSELVHLCNHAPLPVALPLTKAVLLAVSLVLFPVLTPVILVPLAPRLLRRGLVLPVVGVA